MKRHRIMSVVGARPQFVKLAPLSPRLREIGEERIVHSGQHYDYEMSRLFFEELEIPDPDRHLAIGSGTHAEQLGRMLAAMEEELVVHRPDVLVVFGDTNTTLGAALAAAKLGVPIAHVEAGVRGFNRHEPEETNRVLTDRLSAWCLVPTEAAVGHLAREGITEGVHRVGDVMVDALRRARAGDASADDRVRAMGVEPGGYALATFHRPANVDEEAPLTAIVEALAALPMPIVCPVHPRTRARLEAFGLAHALEAAPGVHLSPPVGYLTMLALLGGARLLLTDSGGLQKEAYILDVPCITVSMQTAWEETVASGWNRLVPPDAAAIAAAADGFAGGATHPDVYGDGHAAEAIRDVLGASV